MADPTFDDHAPPLTVLVPGQVIDTMRRMHAPVVITHVTPDADALGSSLALALTWTSDGCCPRISLPPGSLSQRLTFMGEWANVPLAHPEDFTATDGFVVLDAAKKSRCGIEPALRDTNWSAGRKVINIDHHESNTRFGDVNWVVPTASSTAELVYYLLGAADLPISALTASLLYAGIHSDTLGFSLPTTGASSLSVGADLVKRGADVAALGERICRSQRKSEFDLLRVIYANTRLLAEGKLAYSSASYDEIVGAGCIAADIDDQINVPRSLDGVRLAILFTEGHEGKTRINFRSSGDVTVLDRALQFSGGGHRQSAGVVLDCDLKEAIDKVLPRAVEHLRKFTLS